MTKVYYKRTQEIIYNLSFNLITFDFGLPKRSNQGHITFKRLYLIYGSSYDQSFMKHIY